MKPHAALVRTAPSLGTVVENVSHPGAGAVATFVGVVRDHNDGHAVTRLEYEAYEPMAVREMQRLADAIQREIPGVRLAVEHRLGDLAVGDVAIACAASAAHRTEAFQACQALVDRIKAEVPIWKREHGAEGPYWVGWADARCVPGGHGGPSERHVHDHDHGQGHGQGDGHAHAHAHAAHAHAVVTSRAHAPTLDGMPLAVVTVSDTRTLQDDASGEALAAAIVAAGGIVAVRALEPDEPDRIAARVSKLAADPDLRAVIITGGTGIGPRDRTVEALLPLFDCVLDGFGESFRRLSWEQVGARAVLSRAVAGTVGTCLVAALPGSPRAALLGFHEVLLPLLPHAVDLLHGRTQHGGTP